MKDSLRAGIEHEMTLVVRESKTVRNLYPESEEFGAMPEVFATGFFVGLIEWACIRAINPPLDGPREQTVGTHRRTSSRKSPPRGAPDGSPGVPKTLRASSPRQPGSGSWPVLR